MNKYCIKEVLSEQLKGYESTFKQTSLDDNGNRESIYLCNDESKEVFDFDKYVRDNIRDDKLPASPDAIYVGNKKIYFVEFKNSIPAKIDNDKIKSKFKSGTTILKKLLIEFKPIDNEFIFCVVYKNVSSRYFNSDGIEKNIAKFGLDKENKKLNHFYNKIITEDIDYYKKKFTDLDC